MKIISLSEVEKKEVHMEGATGAWRQLPLGSDDGTPVYSYRVFTVEPGGHTPYHNHPYEHMNYVIEGDGALVNEKGEETRRSAGSTATGAGRSFLLIRPGCILEGISWTN